jgi:hypothetical protein
MSKATHQDIVDAGFRPEQFGKPADWSTATVGYVARLLAQCSRVAAQRIGEALYASIAADTLANDYLAKAEKYLAIEELWRRRAAFIDGAATVGNNGGQYLERREYLAHADSAKVAADQALADVQSLFGIEPDIPGSAVSVSVVEHGLYPPVAA